MFRMDLFQCSTSLLTLMISFSAITTSKGTPNVIDARAQSINRGVHNGVAFAKFKAHRFSYLNITSLGTDYVLNGEECGLACVDIPSCFSFNLAAFYDIRGRVLCELLPSDKYNNSNNFTSSQLFHHFSIVSPCLSGPCQNGGSCVSVYEENSYVCLCTKGYTGSICQTVILGCTPKSPAESCLKINASGEGKLVSGNYWLKGTKLKEVYEVYCDMTPGSQGWTLIARFSNRDAKHWMNDTGYWWYDKIEAAGKTIDPKHGADMISPAFWLVSGNELKITRSDNSQFTSLLQTTGNCLGLQTLRSKITSYGDFRNGAVWHKKVCLGNCKVQYGGQYQTTEGFGQARCNGTLQSGDRIGFWCNWGWSSSVMMIGGGGGHCSSAGHGIGVTAAKWPSFKIRESGRPEKEFGNSPWGGTAKNYGLNLWIR